MKRTTIGIVIGLLVIAGTVAYQKVGYVFLDDAAACEVAGGTWAEVDACYAQAGYNASDGCTLLAYQMMCQCESDDDCPGATTCESRQRDGIGVCREECETDADCSGSKSCVAIGSEGLGVCR